LLYTADSLHALATFPGISGDKARRELGHHPRPVIETLTDLHAYVMRTGVVVTTGHRA
jgi:hypothetical protein